ncbi:MAG: hypothetical protein L0Y71_10635 [Gemmataceae bacterium]|nr:hypothetical protein [Gemmataceae bacterium]
MNVMQKSSVLLVAGALLLTLNVSGCGTGDANANLPKTVPVTGKVVLKGGAPVTAGLVQFVPVNGSPYTIMGEIQSGGDFSLSTVVGQTKVPGAIEGDYKVTVLPVMNKSRAHVIRWEQKAKVVAAGDNHVSITITVPQ